MRRRPRGMPGGRRARALLTAWLALAAGSLVGGCASLPPGVSRGAPVAGGTGALAVSTVDGRRQYLLHVPPRAAAGEVARRRPLVLVLHGSRARGAAVREQSGMDAVADSLGFLVAYPDGLGSVFGGTDWNAGACCGASQRRGVDDVAFLRAVISDVEARVPVDRRRVYVAGFSDGARMAHRAACELATEIAAIAPVSGSLALEGCTPRRPVPIVAVHGTADDDVPYRDSAFTAPATTVPGAEEWPPALRFWLAANGCARVRTLATTAGAERWGDGCVADVVLYSIPGGGHGWPRPEAPTAPFAASARIAEFLLRQRLP